MYDTSLNFFYCCKHYSAGRMEGVRNVLKVSELNNSVKERAYQESLHGK